MDKQRDLRLDFIRFLAIYFVINVHCLVPFDDAYLDEGLSSLQGLLTNTLYYLKNAGVPLFIMLSGTLLLGREMTIKDFFKRRFARILIPFTIWSIVVYLFSSVRHQNPIENQSVMDFLYRFSTNGVIGMYWFVYMIIGLYLITPILQRAFRSDNVKEEIIVKYTAILLLILYLLQEICPEIRISDRFKCDQMMEFVLYVWGYYIYKFLRHKNQYGRFAVGVFIIATIALALNIRLHYCSPFLFQYLWPAFLFAILLLVDIQPLRSSVKNVITFVSRTSYGIYLNHFLVISGLMRIREITPPPGLILLFIHR